MGQKIVKEKINFVLKLPLTFDDCNSALYSLLPEAKELIRNQIIVKQKKTVMITKLFFLIKNKDFSVTDLYVSKT